MRLSWHLIHRSALATGTSPLSAPPANGAAVTVQSLGVETSLEGQIEGGRRQQQDGENCRSFSTRACEGPIGH